MTLMIQRLTSAKSIMTFYEEVIANTPDMEQFGRWKSGLYPTEKVLRPYWEKGELWGECEDNNIQASIAITDDGDSLGLHVLAVHPNSQKRGLGRRMVEQAILMAKHQGKHFVRLDALATNLPAHRLYQSLGFVHTHTENLYADNTGWTDFFFFELKI